MRATGLSLLGALFLGSVAHAQAPGPQAPGPQAPAPTAPNPDTPPAGIVVPGQGGSVYVAPGTSTTTTVGPERGVDPNASLPSSSRPKLGDERDGFDLGDRGGGSAVVYGDKGASGIVSESGPVRRPRIPPIHVVRRGDTLWDLSDSYYGNPWQWPRIWKHNPQVENPHWIYPGDQLRMRTAGESDSGLALFEKNGPGAGDAGKGTGSGLVRRGSRVPSGTIVLRDQGFIGDPETDNWGEVAGAVDEQMLLAEGNRVYLLMKSGKSVRAGDQLTLFRSVRQPEKVEGARRPPGEIVAVLGTVKIEKFDAKTNVAQASIVESLDVIERGAKIGPVRRRFDVVPPLASQVNVRARVLTSFYPLVYLGQNQVAFLDRGSEDGLKAGNRLIVTRRGDAWRKTLDSKMSGDRLLLDTQENVEVERTPQPGEPEKFPDETVAELRILRSEKFSSLALVTHSKRELVAGDVAVARAGF